MKKAVYRSTDKLYKVSKRKPKKLLLILGIISAIVLTISSIISFSQSVTLNESLSDVQYNELGSVDYKVYLKDNNYYDTSYLKSGMQYVSSLVKTINVKFNYQMHTTKDLKFDNKYKVVGEVQITERDNPSKILYSKKEDLVSQKAINVEDDNFTINEEVDIDYDKYNDMVASYKKDLGLVVSSNLIIRLEANTNGSYNDDNLNINNDIEIVIPLSESTLDIKLNANNIDNSGTLGDSNELFKINNLTLFIVSMFLCAIAVFNIIIDLHVFSKYFKKDEYNSKLSSILRNYDRLIVNGKIDVDEDNYEKVVIIEDFKEMVDAAQNLNRPILFYEAIPNEKCFFVVMADNILYKYRLTRAFIENETEEKKETKTTTKKTTKTTTKK